MSDTALFIDGRNCLYRAIYAVKADTRYQVKYHYFVILLRQISSWINIIRPSSVHVFWDAPRSTVWRRAVLETYKDRSKSQYVEDISEELKMTTKVANEFFPYMNVRQYIRKQMEADDLIYAATSILHPQKTVIVSTDSDMLQIPYSYVSSSVYDPAKKETIKTPVVSPVWQKALMGDKADSISGYNGIGPVKSAALLESHSDLRLFLDSKGADTFYMNLLLIDLSLCPRLLKNKVYIQKRLAEPVQYCNKTINELIMKHKVQGLLQEFNNIMPHFQQLS